MIEGNKFLVGGGNDITILNPPRKPLTENEALEFAAWIVALSGNRDKFLLILDEVENT